VLAEVNKGMQAVKLYSNRRGKPASAITPSAEPSGSALGVVADAGFPVKW